MCVCSSSTGHTPPPTQADGIWISSACLDPPLTTGYGWEVEGSNAAGVG